MTKELANPAVKAIWYIESHFSEEVTLDDVAKAACVTRYHLSRVFALATGMSIMQYVRGRRLTQAAKRLAAGAPDILAVALESGYDSHEAFTRAFRDLFGTTPQKVRDSGDLTTLKLLEPIKMTDDLLTNLDPPRFEEGRVLLIAGLGERYNSETSAQIPSQWQRFQPHLGHIPGRVGEYAYGVLCNGDDSGNMGYICGIEVADFGRVPKQLSQLRIPEQRYAVFASRGHISTIRQVWFSIWNKGLPESGQRHKSGPEFERYGSEFKPSTGMGGFEIWIPIEP